MGSASAGGRKAPRLGLGSVDVLSLVEAREKAAEGRKLAKAGHDPSFEWRKARETIPTFKQVACRYHDIVKSGWKNGKHRAQWLATLEQHAFPLIGGTRVDLVDATAVQSVLLPIWLKVPETARRVRQRIGAVLDFAHGQGWRAAEAPMRAVSKGLPRQPRKDGHFAAMPYSHVPVLMAKLQATEPSVGRLALQLTILTAARSGEVRGAVWEEFDLDAAVWVIPGGRTKAGQEHHIPLSKPAINILREVQGLITGPPGEPVFPGVRRKPLSDATMAKALRVAGGADYTVHGFRSAFRDWVAEMMPTVPGDVAESALAHSIPNRTEAAYRRAKYFDQRKSLMAAWADYLGGKDNVVRLASNG